MFLDLLREHRELQAQHRTLQQQAQAQAGQAAPAAVAAQHRPSSTGPPSDAASSGGESRAAAAAAQRLQRQLAAVQAELVATQQRETASLAQFCCVALHREGLLTAQLLSLTQRLSQQEQQREGQLQEALQAAKLQWEHERQQLEGTVAAEEAAAAVGPALPPWDLLSNGQMGGDTAGLAAGGAVAGPAGCSAAGAGVAGAAAEPAAEQMGEGRVGSPGTGPNTPQCAAGNTRAGPGGAATAVGASGAAVPAASSPAAAGSLTATHAARSEQGPGLSQPAAQPGPPAVPGGRPCQCWQAAPGDGPQAGGQPGDWMATLQAVPGVVDPELFSVADLLV